MGSFILLMLLTYEQRGELVDRHKHELEDSLNSEAGTSYTELKASVDNVVRKVTKPNMESVLRKQQSWEYRVMFSSSHSF